MRRAWIFELAGTAMSGFALLMGLLFAIELMKVPMTLANMASLSLGAIAFALFFFALAEQCRRRWIASVAESVAHHGSVADDDAEVTIARSETDAALHDAPTGARAEARG